MEVERRTSEELRSSLEKEKEELRTKLKDATNEVRVKIILLRVYIFIRCLIEGEGICLFPDL